MTEETPAYKGESMAIHVESDAAAPSADPVPVGPAQAGPTYDGRSLPVTVRGYSPPQWSDETIKGPMTPVPVYWGRSEAIHVAGSPGVLTPVPIDSCGCCDTEADGCLNSSWTVGASSTAVRIQFVDGVATYTWAPQTLVDSITWPTAPPQYSPFTRARSITKNVGNRSYPRDLRLSFTVDPSPFPTHHTVQVSDGIMIATLELNMANIWDGFGTLIGTAVAFGNFATAGFIAKYPPVLSPTPVQVTIHLRLYHDGTTWKAKFWLDTDTEPAAWDDTATSTASCVATTLSISVMASFGARTIQSGHADQYSLGTTSQLTINEFTYSAPTGPTCNNPDQITGLCGDCLDPTTGIAIPDFMPGFMPAFRRQIGDPTTNLDSFICTLESAAMVLDWHTRGAISVWGGQLIPWCGKTEAQIAATGSNLGNARQAWLHYSQTLDNRSGQTWNDFIACLTEGRAAILQGDYGVLANSEKCQISFEDNHAVAVFPYEVSGLLLTGDPLCRGYHGRARTSLKAYAEAFGVMVYGVTSPQKILFAVSRPWVP